jgi:tetrahydromethanopterin S-methyltransferase subunit B
MIFVGNNLVSGWGTPPGRFLTTVAKTDMVFPFIVSLCILALGLLIIAVEFFRKED